jgi:hypothetical protein
VTTQTVTLRLVAENGQFVGTVRASKQELAGLHGQADESGQSLQRAGRDAESAGARISRMGALAASAAASFAVLAAGATLRSAIREQELMQRNLLRTDALIKATGASAGFSARELHEEAKSLARATLQSTEGVQQAQQILLTFRSVTGDTFTRATELAADLATVTGGGLTGAMTQLGKALEDPVQGINAMTRSGVSFTEQQKETIKSMVETGRQAEAQKLILDELARQYGGVSRAEAQSLAGAQDTLAQATQEAKIKLAEMLNLGPTFTVMINDMAASVDATGDSFGGFESEVTLFADITLGVLGTFSDGVATVFRTVSATMKTAGQGIGATAAALALAVQGDLGGAREVFKLFAEDAQTNFAPVINESSKFRDMIASIRERAEQLRREQAALGTSTHGAAQAFVEAAQAGGLNADALKRQAEQAAKLREQLYPTAAAYDQLIEQIALLAATGGDAAELARFADIWAESLAPIDAAVAAVRQYEQSIALLEIALDDGLISQERFDEAAARLRATLDETAGAAGKTAENAIEPFQDLRDVMLSLDDDWARAASSIVQGLENIAKGSKTAVRGYAQLAQGAAGFFKENTAAYKALSAAAKVATAIEIAQRLEALAVFVASEQTKQAAQGQSVAVTMATEAAKSVAHGVTAVASAMAGLPFPANLAAMAATIAALAGIGVAISGGGGGGGGSASNRSPIRTSGTVLGRPDEDSASIANGIKTLVNIESEGLRISRDMLSALHSIERATSGITSEFAQFAAARGDQSLSFGGTAGDVRFAGSNTRGASLSDMLEMLSTPEGIQAYIQNIRSVGGQIALGLQSIFDDIGTALVSAVTAFGGDAEEARRIFEDLPLGQIVIREGEDIDQAIEALISAVGDSAIEAASQLLNIPLAQFQQFGEGALETLVRLTAQLGILRDGADALGITIENVRRGGLLGLNEKRIPASTEQLIAIADDLAQRAGGVEEFAANMAAFIDLTLTESEKLARQSSLLADALGSVDLQLPSSVEGLRTLAQGLDLTTASGREAFTLLTQLAPQLADYFDAIADREAEIADQRLSLQERLAEAIGDTALAEQVRIELLAQQRAALDASNQALFDQVIAAEAAAQAEQQLAAERQRLASLQIRLAQALGDEAGALALRRAQELSGAASDAERALLQQIFAAEDQAVAARAAVQAQVSYAGAVRETTAAVRDAAAEERERLETQLLQLVGATAELRRRERDALDASNRSLYDSIHALEDLKAANDDTISGLRSLRQSLAEAANDAVGAPLAQVRATFDAIARRALSGDTGALRGLAGAGEQLRDASLAQATTRIEYLRDLARLANVAGAAETLAERQFNELAQHTLLLAGIRTGVDALRGVAVPVPSSSAVMTATPLPVAFLPAGPSVGAGATELTRELAALRNEVAELRRLVKSIDNRGEEIAVEGLKVIAA